MSDILVTGIAPTSDPAQIEQLLGRSDLETERLSIVTKATQARNQNDMHAGGSLTSSSTIMTGSGGTGVPGVGGSNASLSSFSRHGGVPDYLGGLPLIPVDSAHNYNIAIAEGRALVTYKAMPEQAATIEAAFKAAGLRNVKTFRPKETISRG